MCANGDILKGGLRSEKALLEDEDEVPYEIDELTERWHQRLTIDNVALAKRNFKFEVGLGIEVRFVEDNSKEFGAFFEGAELSSGALHNGVLLAANLHVTEIGTDRNDRAMLIDNVQLVELPQSVAPPVTVRLQPSDQSFDPRSRTSKERPSPDVAETLLASTYGEGGFTYRSLGSAPVFDDQGRGEGVQRRPQVMYEISDVTGPLNRYGLNYVKLVNLYRWLTVLIEDRSVRLTILENTDFSIEVVKVLHGPIKLYPAGKQLIGHEQTPTNDETPDAIGRPEALEVALKPAAQTQGRAEAAGARNK